MEQQNGKAPEQPESYGKHFLYLWGPILVKWAVAFGTMMVAAGVLSFIYMSAHYDVVVKAMENQDQMMNLYADITEELMKSQTLIEGVAALITIPVMLFLFHRDRVKEKMRGYIPNKKASIWKYSAVVVIALTVSFALNNVIILMNLSELSASYEETQKVLYTAKLPVQFVCLGILIPICEELVFRGLMFKRIREKSGFIRAALYTSVVFGIMHGNLVQMLYGFLLGMLLSYLYEKYGSVKAPILAHVAMNMLSVVLTHYNVFGWLLADVMRIAAATGVAAMLAATMFVFIQRIEERPDLPEKSDENLAAV